VRVLVVDGTEADRTLLGALLAEHGHAALGAADGVEALEILAREPVDAVLCDVVLPRLDGYRLCYALRRDARLRRLPFVFHAPACAARDDETLCRRLGADACVRKPAPPEALLGALAQAVAHAATRADGPALPPFEASQLALPCSEQLVARLQESNAALAAALARLRASEEKLQAIIQTSPSA
jgi:CheY-like chemotaxis protein